MHIERMLSLVQKATPSKLPYAERLLAAGMLTQWLKDHTAQGGADPRVTTRDQLLTAGVPLECNKEVTKKGGPQPQMLYSNEELSKVKRRRVADGLAPLSKVECVEETRRFNSEFRTLDSVNRQAYIDEAADRRSNRNSAGSTDIAPSYNSMTHFGLCNKEAPVLESELEEVGTQTTSYAL